MSFFAWFSDKSAASKSIASVDKRSAEARKKAGAMAPHKLPPQSLSATEDFKLKRQARREQLYTAIREAMTRAGVLSASYKFKVLSLDHSGNEYLVMMDLVRPFPGPIERFAEIESLVVQNAHARFEILVTAVYWRMNINAALKKPDAQAHEPARPAMPQSEAVAAARALVKASKHSEPSRYDPIQADEVTAFKQALLAASAQGAGSAPAKGVQVRSGPRSVEKGFEDTEMTEDSGPPPALSTTQYGELN